MDARRTKRAFLETGSFAACGWTPHTARRSRVVRRAFSARLCGISCHPRVCFSCSTFRLFLLESGVAAAVSITARQAKRKGLASNKPMADSLTFDTQWQELPYQPKTLRFECAMAMWRADKLILVGGRDNNGNNLRTVETYDISKRQWTPLPPLIKPTSRCTAVVVHNKLYMFDTESEVLELSRLDNTSRFTPLPKCPLNTGYYLIAIAFGPTIYLMNPSGFVAFDTRTNQWNDKLPQMQTPRSRPAVCIMDNKIVVAGGYVNSNSVSSVEMFDIAKETWTTMHESMPISSFGAAAFVVGRSDLFVAGGQIGRAGKREAQTNYLRYESGWNCSWSKHNFPGMPKCAQWYCPIAVATTHKRLFYIGVDHVVRSLAFHVMGAAVSVSPNDVAASNDSTSSNNITAVTATQSITTASTAITYDQLMEARQLVSNEFADKETQVTMRDVSERIVVPICRQMGTSYAKYRNPNGCQVEAFVSHSWDEPFDDFVKSIEKAFQSLFKKPNMWICAFALNQCDSETIENQMGLQESSSLESTPFVTALRAASMFVVVRNSVTDLYHRVWCVCELMYAKKFGFIPNKTFVTGPDSFSDSKTSCLDAESYNIEDKAKILKELLTQHNYREIDDFIDQFRKSQTLL